jgi:hypothetical protein
MRLSRLHIALTILIVLLCLGALLRLLVTGATPWEETGSFTIAVRATPLPSAADHVLTLGIDDARLHHETNDEVPASMRTRRVTLDASVPELTTLLNVSVRTGTYRSISFCLTSPELRNDWEGDTAPTPLSLLQEDVTLPVPFTVQTDTDAVIVLSFETDTAIRNDHGKQVFVPVIHVETRANATTHETPHGTLTVEGGTIEHNATYGMKWDGTMRQNFRARDRVTAPTTHTPASYTPPASEQIDTPTKTASTTTPPSSTSTEVSTNTSGAGSL